MYGQDPFRFDPLQVDTLIVVSSKKSELLLPEKDLPDASSLFVYKNRNQLLPQLNFKFESESNRLFFYVALEPEDSLRIVYKRSPFRFLKDYTFLRVDTLRSKKEGTDSIAIRAKPLVNPFADFGGSLKRSGSIVRGIRIGNNSDMTINSGLNLQLSGNLTEDVEIVAALTDESTPIQPEGNTQTLNEVDKVFIEFKSPWVRGTLGDFNLNYSQSEFGNLSRKLQGISLLGNYEKFELGATVATTRGFFNNVSFIGQEGNQGPYQLTGKNGEREIIILAGTERIWINGEKMTRGENNDYIIEYGNGQVTFTNRRLITSESRIEVDFEYYPALQKYTRNVYSAIHNGNLFDNRFNYSVRFYSEGDDPAQLLETEGILSDEEKDILKAAGDDPLSASVPGVTETEPGQGYYSRVDTLIGGKTYSYYVYQGKDLGNYTVVFSSVGTGNGDYVRDRLGVYRWVGIGKGQYLPVKLLPLPNQQQLLDLQMEFRPFEFWNLRTEYAISHLDRNKLSPADDSDNQGSAFNIVAEKQKSALKLGRSGLGQWAFSAKGRYVEEQFNPVDRLNQPDHARYWNLTGAAASNEERSLESALNYYPVNWINITGNFGTLRRVNLQSNRYLAGLDWQNERLIDGKLKHEIVQTEYTQSKNDWLRQSAVVGKTIGYFRPEILAEREQRKEQKNEINGGFEFMDLGGKLNLVNHKFLNGYIQYNLRNDDIFDPAQNGEKVRQAVSETRRLRLDLQEWKRFSGSLEIVNRRKNYTAYFEQTRFDSLQLQFVDAAVQDTVWRDRKTNLAEIILNNYQWDRALDIRWQYRISTELLSLREKVYLDVGEGRGNLRFDEELNEYLPDPDGNFVLYVIPSGSFEPVTNLQTSVRLLLSPERFFKRENSGWGKILKNLSSDSYFRIDEETKAKDLTSLYLMNLSNFQGDSTLRGTFIFNEDLYIMKRNRDLSFRLRYRYQKDRSNQYLDVNENEDRLKTESGIRASYKVTTAIKAQSELRQKLTFRASKANPSRNRDIMAWIWNQNFAWRPNPKWEFGLDTENGLETDIANNKDLNLRYLRALMSGNYALLQKGRISAEIEYQDVKILDNPLDSVIPFEMGRGKKAGVSRRWQLRGDYTVAENVVVSLFYSGRDDSGFERVIHTGQAEIRAYF